jgi:hypothetical protein
VGSMDHLVWLDEEMAAAEERIECILTVRSH